jgi:hypothetical protein
MKKVLILFLLFAATQSFAQQTKGDVSLTFAGTYTSFEGVGFGQIFGKAGYMVTDRIEAGGKPTILLGTGFSGGGLGVFGTYNFLTKDVKLVPYAGAELSFLSIKTEGSDAFSQTNLGLYGGAKYFVTEQLNIDAGLNLSTNLSNSVDADLGTIVTFQIGIGFVIGKLTTGQ